MKITIVNTILGTVGQKTLALFVVGIGVATASDYLFSNHAIAQTISQTDNSSVSPITNINEVKTFVYSWFALLDRQVSEISLLKFWDKNNLMMEFPK